MLSFLFLYRSDNMEENYKAMQAVSVAFDDSIETMYWLWQAGETELTQRQEELVQEYMERQEIEAGVSGDTIEIEVPDPNYMEPGELRVLSRIVSKMHRLGLNELLLLLSGNNLTTETSVMNMLSRGSNNISGLDSVTFNNETRGFKEMP